MEIFTSHLTLQARKVAKKNFQHFSQKAAGHPGYPRLVTQHKKYCCAASSVTLNSLKCWLLGVFFPEVSQMNYDELWWTVMNYVHNSCRKAASTEEKHMEKAERVFERGATKFMQEALGHVRTAVAAVQMMMLNLFIFIQKCCIAVFPCFSMFGQSYTLVCHSSSLVSLVQFQTRYDTRRKICWWVLELRLMMEPPKAGVERLSWCFLKLQCSQGRVMTNHYTPIIRYSSVFWTLLRLPTCLSPRKSRMTAKTFTGQRPSLTQAGSKFIRVFLHLLVCQFLTDSVWGSWQSLTPPKHMYIGLRFRLAWPLIIH